PPAGISVEALERLRRKYERLAALREAREILEARGCDRFPPEEAAARKAAFRRVARAFPGALRELDSLPAAELRAREARVRRARDRAAAALPSDDPWVELVLDFHLTLREMLLARRWLAARAGKDEAETRAALRARWERQA